MYLDRVFEWLAQSAAVPFAMGAFASVLSVLTICNSNFISSLLEKRCFL